jgi:L-threonylcarbamoyladenylate synthase
VVLLPTSTLYGLSGRACDAASAVRIASLKQRPVGPLIVLVDRIPAGLEGLARTLAERFWPGPLTLLVPNPGLDVAPVHCSPLVALRWDPRPELQPLIAALGPVTSTSANVHGAAPVTRPSELMLDVDAVLDVGPLEGDASTLVDVPGRRVLRAGALAEQVAPLLR